MRSRSWNGVPPALEPFALFSTSDPATAERLGTPFLGRHRLTPRAGGREAFHATMHAVVLGSVTLGYLQLATATEVALASPTSRYLIIEERSPAAATTTASGTALVVQPGQPTTVDAPAGGVHLVIVIDQRALLAHLGRLLGRAADGPLVFDPELDLRAGTSSRWNLAVEMLHAELVERGSLLRSGVGQVQLEEFLMSSLLYGQRSTYWELLAPAQLRPEHHAVRAAKDFIGANLAEPVTSATVAMAAGISPRTLQAAFRTELRTTPTAYIRSRRLELARADLTDAGRGMTVTEIATRWGFTHLGRFAADYRDRFCESPSQTLRGRRQPLR